jgi:hypothetical protein
MFEFTTVFDNEPEIKELDGKIKELSYMLNDFNEKPTVTLSKKIRKKLIFLKENITRFRLALVEADKKTYKKYK